VAVAASQQPKMGKIFFEFIKRKRWNSSCPARRLPEIRVFKLIIGFQFADSMVFGHVT